VEVWRLLVDGMFGVGWSDGLEATNRFDRHRCRGLWLGLRLCRAS
jgi:hypothetical protein